LEVVSGLEFIDDIKKLSVSEEKQLSAVKAIMDSGIGRKEALKVIIMRFGVSYNTAKMWIDQAK
jgi:hypothetical protein